jgi:mono/diheme cytochrome c family protein
MARGWLQSESPFRRPSHNRYLEWAPAVGAIYSKGGRWRFDVNAFVRALAVLIVVGAVVGGVLAYSVARRGLSTRTEPSRVEESLARRMRQWATPRAARSTTNPVEATPAVLQDARAHFADHCAVCHANNGSGDTAIGRSLYPRAPDMRGAATQALTDGELFSIIENGIRLTGMPAWGTGTPEGEHASWALVHFVRRLPSLTEDEIQEMESLNPKGADQWRADEDARRFLAGEEVEPSSPAPPHKHDELHR